MTRESSVKGNKLKRGGVVCLPLSQGLIAYPSLRDKVA